MAQQGALILNVWGKLPHAKKRGSVGDEIHGRLGELRLRLRPPFCPPVYQHLCSKSTAFGKLQFGLAGHYRATITPLAGLVRLVFTVKSNQAPYRLTKGCPEHPLQAVLTSLLYANSIVADLPSLCMAPSLQ